MKIIVVCLEKNYYEKNTEWSRKKEITEEFFDLVGLPHHTKFSVRNKLYGLLQQSNSQKLIELGMSEKAASYYYDRYRRKVV